MFQLRRKVNIPPRACAVSYIWVTACQIHGKLCEGAVECDTALVSRRLVEECREESRVRVADERDYGWRCCGQGTSDLRHNVPVVLKQGIPSGGPGLFDETENRRDAHTARVSERQMPHTAIWMSSGLFLTNHTAFCAASVPQTHGVRLRDGVE